MARTTRIARLLLAASYQITHIDPEEDWELAEKVDQIANRVGIRPDSTKHVAFVATTNDSYTVVGGAYVGITEDHEANQPEPWYLYSFDIVVDPDYQWGRKIGLDLIKAAEKERSYYAEPYGGNVRTRLWVVNPKLARYMAEHKGYDTESEYSDGSAHLIKW